MVPATAGGVSALPGRDSPTQRPAHGASYSGRCERSARQGFTDTMPSPWCQLHQPVSTLPAGTHRHNALPMVPATAGGVSALPGRDSPTQCHAHGASYSGWWERSARQGLTDTMPCPWCQLQRVVGALCPAGTHRHNTLPMVPATAGGVSALPGRDSQTQCHAHGASYSGRWERSARQGLTDTMPCPWCQLQQAV